MAIAVEVSVGGDGTPREDAIVIADDLSSSCGWGDTTSTGRAARYCTTGRRKTIVRVLK